MSPIPSTGVVMVAWDFSGIDAPVVLVTNPEKEQTHIINILSNEEAADVIRKLLSKHEEMAQR